ncbi:MAG TPA: hypothetical protein VG964_00580 [Candidatus Saccharimonadales bacterium]|nr:hypothetical protein [Candidatus Saccharimonadales bacterium]
MIIGFSIGNKGLERPDAPELLEGMLSAGCQAIQLQVRPDIVSEWPEHLQIVRKFEYRTIHLPYLKEAANDPGLNESLRKLASFISASNFTFHPVNTDSFTWLAEEFGDQVCAENMDWQKDFGQSPRDLQRVFADLPNAGWTYDVNHVMTNDPSLRLGEELYERFAPRLRQYHLSGFGGEHLPHTLLADTRQDKIIRLVKDLSKPIILESLGSVNLQRYQEELDYVSNFL